MSVPNQQLVDLNPSWIGRGGEHVRDKDGNPVPERHGTGIILTCPCGTCPEHNWLYVPFENPLDGGAPDPTEHALWKRTGTNFLTLTLHPSVRRTSGCGWHGFIRDGEVLTV